MPFLLTTGEFVPEAGRPDGDSMRFRPDDPTPLFALQRRGRAPRINQQNGTIQLRFEGIDTMESGALAPFSSDATRSNLELCGVPDGTGTARGYILSTQIGPNGRPIAFVFSGTPPEQDGANVFLDEDRMRESVNFQQVTRGHAYPLFYDSLFFDLRTAIAAEVQMARSNGSHIWSADLTNTGAQYTGAASVDSMPPIFPKLWRRIDTYSKNRDISDPTSLTEFIAYLQSLREERVLVVSESRLTGFDDLVNVSGDTVRLTHQPEDLVVVAI